MDEFFCYECGASWSGDGDWLGPCGDCRGGSIGSKIKSQPIDLILGIFESEGHFWMEACSSKESAMYCIQIPKNTLIIPRGVVYKNSSDVIDFYSGEILGQTWIQ